MNKLESKILDCIQSRERGYSILELITKFKDSDNNIGRVMDAVRELEAQELIVSDGGRYHAFEHDGVE